MQKRRASKAIEAKGNIRPFAKFLGLNAYDWRILAAYNDEVVFFAVWKSFVIS